MKKLLPYLIGAFALLALIMIVLFAPRRPRKLDERITLRQRDKIPYGTYVAHRLLQASFSNAHVSVDKAAPGYWVDVDTDTSNQAVFLISKRFSPTESEMQWLRSFIQQGNYVFIITQSLDWEAGKFFNLQTDKTLFENTDDSLRITLEPPTVEALAYQYPGRRFDSYFSTRDTATALSLGTNGAGQTNFIQLQSGRGKLFIHLAPLAFSNYFLLHQGNVRYFQNIISLLPPGIKKLVWNEYYLSPHRPKQDEPSVLRVLWRYPSFRMGLLTIIGTLLLFVLSAMRRRQRQIPAYTPPANESLDFVRTIGRLYYDRRDHHNLAKKMTLYFMDHVRARYKISALQPGEDLVEELHAKTGYDHEELKKLVDFMRYLENYDFITEAELARFYRQLENFYKTTDGTTV